MTVCRRAGSIPRGTANTAHAIAVRAVRKVAVAARSRRGAVAVEFALGLLPLLLLLYGIVEFARALWTQNTIEYAIEESTRFAMVNDGNFASDAAGNNAFDGAIQTVVRNNVLGLVTTDPPFSLVVGFEPPAGTRNFVTVTGTYRFDFLVPIVGVGPLNLSSTSRIPVVR